MFTDLNRIRWSRLTTHKDPASSSQLIYMTLSDIHGHNVHYGSGWFEQTKSVNKLLVAEQSQVILGTYSHVDVRDNNWSYCLCLAEKMKKQLCGFMLGKAIKWTVLICYCSNMWYIFSFISLLTVETDRIQINDMLLNHLTIRVSLISDCDNSGSRPCLAVDAGWLSV